MITRKMFQTLTQSHNSKYLFFLILAIALTTWIHHLYGGWKYDTLYRILIPCIAIPLFLSMTFQLQLMALNKKGKYVRLSFVLVVFTFWILPVGLIEGGYNHGLKNLLFFSGISKEKLALMFPPEFGDQSLFEMPSDIFFEATGILQFFIGLAIVYYLRNLMKELESAG